VSLSLNNLDARLFDSDYVQDGGVIEPVVVQF